MNISLITSKGLAIGVCLLLLMTATSSVVSAQSGSSIDVQGSPDISVYAPDNEVTPGSETTFTVQLDNDGEVTDGDPADRQYVTTARSVITTLEADDIPITVKTGTQSVGDITESEPENVDFRIEVPNDAEPGTYEMELDMEYTYTSKAEDLPGYRPSQTTQSRSISKEVKIEISNDARFRITDINSTLRVGEEGDITGEIENVGGEDATNAEVQFPTDAENLFPQETAVAVGNIEAGESAEFRIPIEVGSEAEAVPKRFDLPVSFRDENGIRQTDDDPEFLADIGPERDTFGVEPVNRTITAGSGTTFEVTFTNNREETLTDIEPKLFTDSPFSSSSSEGFVESLAPGESETVTFDLSAEGSATPKTYPVTVDVRYQDAEGNSQITDSYRLPVEVLEPEESGGLGSLGTVAMLIVSLLAVGGGYVWYRGQ
ncbi:COG1361 S-layer family protein [Halohasta litorea]|uniref:COG1361 S-layer family protein n=1 Tax=Halohasta litorea TaxID=869891 RepID=A0ABD6D3T8_9EURY|nr:NEW3 domain-containing protein [Halohasta litorea]